MSQAIPNMRKAAILLRSLDEASAAQLMRHLQPACAKALAEELAAVQGIDPGERQIVIEEIKHRTQLPGATKQAGTTPQAHRSQRQPARPRDGLAVSETGSRPALQPYPHHRGQDNSAADRPGAAPLPNVNREQSFRFLSDVPLQSLCTVMGQEQPRVVAFVLSRLPSEVAGTVLENLPDRIQHDVIRHMGTEIPLQPALQNQIEERIRDRLNARDAAGQHQADAVTLAARLLDRDNVANAPTGLRPEDPQPAEKLPGRTAAFEDLSHADNKALVAAASHMEPADLALALTGATKQFRDRCLRLLPGRVAKNVKGHMKGLGPVRLRDIEHAQCQMVRFLTAARPLRPAPPAFLDTDQ